MNIVNWLSYKIETGLGGQLLQVIRGMTASGHVYDWLLDTSGHVLDHSPYCATYFYYCQQFHENMAEVSARFNICRHGSRGFEVQREHHRAAVFNEHAEADNWVNAVLWSIAN